MHKSAKQNENKFGSLPHFNFLISLSRKCICGIREIHRQETKPTVPRNTSLNITLLEPVPVTCLFKCHINRNCDRAGSPLHNTQARVRLRPRKPRNQQIQHRRLYTYVYTVHSEYNTHTSLKCEGTEVCDISVHGTARMVTCFQRLQYILV
jgi:hypothetical protein